MLSCKLLTFLPLTLILASCSRDPRTQAQRLVANGNKFFNKGKYREASLMYKQAYTKDLRYGEAYYRLGLTDLKLGNYSEAAHVFQRTVDLDPNNVDAIGKLANIYLLASTGDATHSVQLQKDVTDLAGKLIQLDKNSYEGHRILGEMLLLHRQFPEAIKEFEMANSTKPYQPDLVLTYFQALVQNDQFPAAEKLAHDLIAREKTYSPIYDVLYIQYMRRKQPDDAEQILKLKSDNNPQRANYLMQLAMHYYLVNRRADMDAVIQRVTDEKKYPEGHLLAGDFFFFRAREYDHAEQQYQAAVKAFPKDKAVYQKRLVELYATFGDPTKRTLANQLLAAVIKDNPKDSDALAMRAALMLTTGDKNQINAATVELQSLIAKNPQNHLLHFNLARALIAKGDIEGARLHLEEAVKIRRDFLAAREMLARIYLAKADPGKALKAADEIIALDRNNLKAHLVRSTALLAVGDRDEARKELDFIGRTYPQNSDARYQVGLLALQDKDYKLAEQVFGDIYKANPEDRRGLVGVTETMIARGHMDEAIKETERAVQREPERRDLKLYVANDYKRANRFDEAIKIYQTLLDKEPKNADLLYKLGETQRLKGDLNSSMDNFRKCSQAAPADTLCLMMLAMDLQAIGRDDQAKPVYEQMLKIQPDHPIALNNLAYIKAQEGIDLDQALNMAQRAVQKEPGSLELADTLGWIYIKKSLSQNAVQIYRDLVAKAPANPTFHYHYGMALMQQGDRPTAKKEFETALKNKPSKVEEDKVHEQLQKLG